MKPNLNLYISSNSIVMLLNKNSNSDYHKILEGLDKDLFVYLYDDNFNCESIKIQGGYRLNVYNKELTTHYITNHIATKWSDIKDLFNISIKNRVRQ